MATPVTTPTTRIRGIEGFVLLGPTSANDLIVPQVTSPRLVPRLVRSLAFSCVLHLIAPFREIEACIRQAWGAERVPVCETLPGRHHFSALEALTEPDHRLHRLAMELLTR